ncbi:unnamed protein product, partial [Polarella glacialis]
FLCRLRVAPPVHLSQALQEEQVKDVKFQDEDGVNWRIAVDKDNLAADEPEWQWPFAGRIAVDRIPEDPLGKGQGRGTEEKKQPGTLSLYKDGAENAVQSKVRVDQILLHRDEGYFQFGQTEVKVPSGMGKERIIQQVFQLMRFQEDPKLATETLRRIAGAQESNPNFFVVKFRKEGTVVWAPPKGINVWDRCGTTLFVVKLADAVGTLVRISVPSFDIRFERETSWMPVKTLVKRWADATRIFKGSEQYVDKKTDQSGKAKSTKTSNKDKATSKKQEVDEVEEMEDDGHTVPVKVSKHAFCCRIRKRMSSHVFDRSRTSNWYRNVLSDVFPEVQDISISNAGNQRGDFNTVKHFFLSKFLNLRTPLVHGPGTKDSDVGSIKGHVSVLKILDGPLSGSADATPSAGPSSPSSPKSEYSSRGMDHAKVGAK